MKVTTIIDVQSALDLATYRKDIEREVQQMARAAEREALLMARIGAMVGIYLTPQGQYQRTGTYLNSIYAIGKVQRGVVTVEIGDRAPYASYLEYGSVGTLSPAIALQLAEALGMRPSPLYMGRSGLNWVAPNPAITRAAVFAGLRMQNHLTTVM